MGCTSSKLDDLPAVALCRERCAFLDEAIHCRYALAEAHIAYIHSLGVVGNSLQSFIAHGVVNYSGSPPSPKLNLPPFRKRDQVPAKKVEASMAPSHHLSHSNSGSHLHIHSDSDDESGSLHYSGHSTPLHPVPTHGGYMGYMDVDQERFVSYPPGGGGGGGGGGFMQMNYMRNTVTPSVVYEHRPMSPENVYHMGESSSAYYSYPYSNMNSNPHPYYGYSNYGAGAGAGAGAGGFYGSSPPSGVYGSMSPAMAPASSSKPPPPPPPPPSTSTWDFMNLFDSYDRYYSAYTPSRDSKEVREEEGIPDLEEESYQREVVKKVYGNQRFVEDNGAGKNLKSTVKDEMDDDTESSLYKTRPSPAVENAQMKYEVHVVDKKIVDKGEGSEDRGNGAGFSGRAASIDEVAREIAIQFKKASESGNEIAKMLEVGKLPYQRKHGASKMLHLSTPSLSIVSSLPSTSKNQESSSDKASSSEVGFVEDLPMSSRNLSATLQKIYLWEKKLYNEVKSEEKMRVIHERKCRKLKGMNERGAEAQKIDATRTLIRSLSTKIKMAIQVVDKISVTINTIRDEELWPQVNELIHGFMRMWKCMLECHHNQYQAIKEARSLGSIGSGKNRIEPESALQLSRELYNWTFRFSTWVTGQKSYVRALNNCLLKCLLYEPEETADGIAPFSPGRIGAPPVFIICNQWFQSLDRISEKEVIESMRSFSSSVLQIWEQDGGRMVHKDVDRKGRNIDREEQKITKEIQAMEKKMVMVAGDGNALSLTGNVVYQSDTSSPSLQAGLQRVFESLERFTTNSMKVYEELLRRSIEEQANQER